LGFKPFIQSPFYCDMIPAFDRGYCLTAVATV